MTVFPPRDLPGDSDDWGREVENRSLGLNSSISRGVSTADNNARFVGGQLAVQGRQIQEQIDRTTLIQYPADLSVTGSATIEPFPRSSRTIVFNPPGGARIAQLEVYVRYGNQNFGNVSLFAYLSYEGSIVSKFQWRPISEEVAPLSAGSAPLEGHGLAYVTLPREGSATFSLTIIRVGFTASSSTETVSDIRAYLTPFQKTM